MPPLSFAALLLPALALSSACAASDPRNIQATPTCSGPPTDPNCILTVDDEPFVRAAVGVTDGTSTARVEHNAGSFCLSGTLDPGPTGTGWGAVLVLAFDERRADGTSTPLDAAALGIAQIEFTITNPPVTGVRPAIDQLTSLGCNLIPDCLTSFLPMDASGNPTTATATGTSRTPFSAFKQPSWGDPEQTFDASLLANVAFTALPLAGAPIDYDFCVRDLAFLDANGDEVSP